MSPRKALPIDADYARQSVRLGELRLDRAQETLLREVMAKEFAGVDDDRLLKIDRLRGIVMQFKASLAVWRRALKNAERRRAREFRGAPDVREFIPPIPELSPVPPISGGIFSDDVLEGAGRVD